MNKTTMLAMIQKLNQPLTAGATIVDIRIFPTSYKNIPAYANIQRTIDPKAIKPATRAILITVFISTSLFKLAFGCPPTLEIGDSTPRSCRGNCHKSARC